MSDLTWKVTEREGQRVGNRAPYSLENIFFPKEKVIGNLAESFATSAGKVWEWFSIRGRNEEKGERSN